MDQSTIVPTAAHISKVTDDYKLYDDNSKYDVTLKPPTGTFRPQVNVTIPPTEEELNDANLCSGKPADAFTTLHNGTSYVFRGYLFWTLNVNGHAPGPPRRISDVWGIQSPIDAVFTRCNCDGNTFFIKGQKYWRFQNGKMDSGYPKTVSQGFSGLKGKIVAALSMAAYNNKPEVVHFFKEGGQFQTYSYRQRTSKTCSRQQIKVKHTIHINQNVSRFKRQAIVLFHHHLNRPQQTVSRLSVEMPVKKYWRGFPQKVTSAISSPNARRLNNYEYFVLSGDRRYAVDPVKQMAVKTKKRVAKSLYSCP
eukprot:gi/632956061/ref/XP_007893773.1/ PREDICTED: proteoglycan 4 [Callorhinchus milii]